MTDSDGGPDEAEAPVPPAFTAALAALRAYRPREDVRLRPMPAPRRLAPHACAWTATVEEPAGAPSARSEQEPAELADGRFVLLYDPDQESTWQGPFRVVTLARANVEPEMGQDPLLPEVTWSWLLGAQRAHGLSVRELSGTVTRAGSHYFGGMADREPHAELELRASWTPEAEDPGEVASHLAAWCELLCQCAGLPPVGGEGESVEGEARVVALRNRFEG